MLLYFVLLNLKTSANLHIGSVFGKMKDVRRKDLPAGVRT